MRTLSIGLLSAAFVQISTTFYTGRIHPRAFLSAPYGPLSAQTVLRAVLTVSVEYGKEKGTAKSGHFSCRSSHGTERHKFSSLAVRPRFLTLCRAVFHAVKPEGGTERKTARPAKSTRLGRR